MTDHTALKEAAEAATPGPWDVMEDETYCGGFGCTPDGCYGHSTGKGTWVDGPHIVEFFEGAGILIDEDLTEDEQAKLDKEAYDQACADAHFIALANPSKILELLAENERLRSWHGQSVESHALTTAELGEAQSENARLLAENEALREALEPFAKEAERWIEMGDRRHIREDTDLMVSDLRRARALTEKQDG